MAPLRTIFGAYDDNGFKRYLREAKAHDLPLIYAQCIAKRLVGFAAMALAEMARRQALN